MLSKLYYMLYALSFALSSCFQLMADTHTHTHSLSLSLSPSLSLSLSVCCSCLLSPFLTCLPSPAILLAVSPISHHPCPYPFKPPISLIHSNPFLYLCYSLSPFHLTCLLPSSPGKPPFTLSSPHLLLPSYFHFPQSLTSLSLSLLFLPFSHSFTFFLTLSYNSPCFFSLLHTSPLTLLSPSLNLLSFPLSDLTLSPSLTSLSFPPL